MKDTIDNLFFFFRLIRVLQCLLRWNFEFSNLKRKKKRILVRTTGYIMVVAKYSNSLAFHIFMTVIFVEKKKRQMDLHLNDGTICGTRSFSIYCFPVVDVLTIDSGRHF